MHLQRMLRAGALAFGLAGFTGGLGAQFASAAPFNADGAFQFQTVIDGHEGEQYDGTPFKSDARMHIKPTGPADKTLTVENLLIHDVVNQKALNIVAAQQPDGLFNAFSNITVRNYEARNIYRDGRWDGLHIDHLRIAGGGFNQDVPTDVTLENITLNGGDATPLLIQDGVYGTITLRNVTLENTLLGAVQISTKGGGSIGKVVIEDSPGLKVAFMDRDDTIGAVDVINSPGASTNWRNYVSTPNGGVFEPDTGYYYSRQTMWRPSLSYEGSLVPEPGLLSLLPGAALLLRRRRRS